MAFTGTAGEYFGIWLVNIVLTLLTLGIYSAWATVRTKRYFYGSSWLDGHSLDYLAPPVAILKGRLVAFALLFLLSLVNGWVPESEYVTTPLLLALLPWVILRSLRFRARVTEWRNVRFHWRGGYWPIAGLFFLAPLLGLLSFGLLWSLVSRMQQRYLAANLDFGTARFLPSLTLGPYYRALFLTLGLLLLVYLVLALVLVLPLFLLVGATEGLGRPHLVQLVSILIPVFLVIGFFVGRAFWAGLVRKILLNGLLLQGGHRFSSDLGAGRWFGIVLTNFLAILLTAGLAYPWARVRAWRVQAVAIEVLPGGPLDAFVDDQRRRGDVYSSEFAEMEGFDIGL